MVKEWILFFSMKTGGKVNYFKRRQYAALVMLLPFFTQQYPQLIYNTVFSFIIITLHFSSSRKNCRNWREVSTAKMLCGLKYITYVESLRTFLAKWKLREDFTDTTIFLMKQAYKEDTDYITYT